MAIDPPFKHLRRRPQNSLPSNAEKNFPRARSVPQRVRGNARHGPTSPLIYIKSVTVQRIPNPRPINPFRKNWFQVPYLKFPDCSRTGRGTTKKALMQK